MSAAVGARIRELRQSRGTSLAALAASTGLGKGTLSELERGQRNPTLDTLFAIATDLGIPLSDLLTGERFEAPRESARARGQSIDAALLDRWTEETGVTEVYRIVISPETRRSLAHAPGVTEILTLIEGEAEVGDVDAPVRLRAGDTHAFAGDTAHLYRGIAARSVGILIMGYPMGSPDPQ